MSREKNEEELKRKITTFLKSTPNTYYNMSEIARAIGKSSPTVSKAIEKLEQESKVMVADKKSMKLIKILEVKK